uniref:Uncharacterized protein n=1 Tax=Magallana gigas TaxID=29159 RepID=K1QZJ0_MAGGI
MKFKPALLAGKEVKTYVWNKVRGVYKDPSFAKFEPSVSSQLEIYFNEEHQVQNRMFHNPEEPATLYLTDLRKSDQEQYTLVISYVDSVGTLTEGIIDLEVQDVCFEKPKDVGKCAVSTCYTGENGVLKIPGNTEQAVKGYKQVKVCDDKTSGNYSCCNTAGTCLVQDFLEPMARLLIFVIGFGRTLLCPYEASGKCFHVRTHSACKNDFSEMAGSISLKFSI